MKYCLFCILIYTSTYATGIDGKEEQTIKSHGEGCAITVAFMNIDNDTNNIRHACFKCLNPIPMGNIKTDNNMQKMIEMCTNKYKKEKGIK